MRVGYYETAAGNRPTDDTLNEIAPRFAAQIQADIHTVATYGIKAPVRTKAIKGHSPLREIITGGFRTFYYCEDDTVIVLHVCKKDDQIQGIKLAAKRMKELRG